jgi:hypothetical protein
MPREKDDVRVLAAPAPSTVLTAHAPRASVAAAPLLKDKSLDLIQFRRALWHPVPAAAND